MAPKALVAQVVARTRRLAAIPAPPFHEQDRAELVSRWWSEEAECVSIDEVGNVWARVRAGSGPAVVAAAHLDTVFDTAVEHGTEERDGRLYGPSVGDDSVAVAALGALTELLPQDPGGEVWILGTVGEEGLGNLTGIRHALEQPPVEIGAVIAIEGNWFGRVCLTGVGSVRRRVTLEGPGGHAWEAAHIDSAVHGVARVTAALEASSRPAGARTAINVGRIGGGTGINVRAGSAWFEVDLRADTPAALDQLTTTLETCLSEHAGELSVTSQSLGDRPAGGLDPNHPLAQAGISCLTDAGVDVQVTAASTDANAAHAAGVPALALGVTRGANEHTIDEWIELNSIPAGLDVLAATITEYLSRR
jgi:tripeptide aminopeptidase